MRFAPRTGTLLAVLSALSIVMNLSAFEAAELKAGEPFPDLVFPSLDGGAPASLSDFRGKKVVLHVFASW